MATLGVTVIQPAGTIAVSPLVLLAGAAVILILIVVAITAITMASQAGARLRRTVQTADDAVRAAAVAVGVDEEMVMPWVERGDSPSLDDLTELIRRGRPAA